MNCNIQDEDHFARLPDALLLEIINRLQDAKSLCRCMLVSKRFTSIIPQVYTVSLTMPPRNSIPINHQHKQFKRSLIRSLANKLIVEPLYFLLRVIKPKSSLLPFKDYDDDYDGDCSCYSPNEILKNFNEVRLLHIRLPRNNGGQVRLKGDGFLKWKAEFGSKLNSCVVLGATSCQRSDQEKNNEEHEQQGSSLTDEELKLRVVWTLSSLIAASATHHLVQQVVSKHPMLEGVVITDASEQGRLCMKKEQIKELRNYMDSEVKLQDSSMPLGRSRLPALKMKLWHVPELELPGSGYLMKGATLVMIRPADGHDHKVKISSSDDFLVGAFDGDEEYKLFDEAFGKMVMKRRVYTLEMNSF